MPIDGLKLSGALAQFNFLTEKAHVLLEAFHRLTSRRINMTLVTLDAADGRWRCNCCIAGEDLAAARASLGDLGITATVICPVGSVTLFPHKSRWELLHRLLTVFDLKALPVHGIASSASTLSLVTDYPLLDEAACAVTEVADLPENHTPMRCQIHVRQV